MKYIGAHVSAAGGVSQAPVNAHEIGAKAFALFTGSNTRWASKPIKAEEAAAFISRCAEYGYTPDHILPHDNFLINLGSPDDEKLQKSRKSFLEEMQRCEQLGLTMLNFHPGSHLNTMDEDECLTLIAESLNLILPQTKGVTAVIENTAGQGSNLGFSFAQIARIIELVEDKERIGVCFDTCHGYSAGYDIATPEGYRKTWEEFNSEIGAHYLRGIHLNDSKRQLNSRIDRHESIGKGTLGTEFFKRFMNDSRFDNIPVILETPDDSLWKEEIEWLYSLAD